MNRLLWISLSLYMLVGTGCKKDEIKVYPDNTIPPYSEVSTLLVENYVNRLYIDIIGREPTDIEMAQSTASLESGKLSAASRTALVQRLMFSEEDAGGGSTYKSAYFQKFYDDQKARFLDGVSESTLDEEYSVLRFIAVQDSMMGNMLSYQIVMLEANKIKAVMDSRLELQNGTIEIDEMCRRMMFNSIYDDINMNTFNFINASFDDCFYRFPTEAELNAAFDPIEFNGPGQLFGQSVSNKTEYLQVLTHSNEFAEGMIRWCYRSLLSRDAETIEVISLLDDFNAEHKTSTIQQFILISDEYAGFDQ